MTAKKSEAPTDRGAKVQALVDLVEELTREGDSGDGTYVHLVAIQQRVKGLQDAQRAWEHITGSPPSRGAARAASGVLGENVFGIR